MAGEPNHDLRFHRATIARATSLQKAFSKNSSIRRCISHSLAHLIMCQESGLCRLNRRLSCRYGNLNNDVAKESLQYDHLALVAIDPLCSLHANRSAVTCEDVEGYAPHARKYGIIKPIHSGTSVRPIQRVHHKRTIIFGYNAVLSPLLAYADPMLVSRNDMYAL
jgi:hypothetical protein